MADNKSVLGIPRCLSVNATISTMSTSESSHSMAADLASQSSLSNASPIGNKKQPKQVKQDMKKDSKVTTESLPPQDKKAPPKEAKKVLTTKQPISKLSIIAIGLTLCLAGFVYYHGHQQATAQKFEINQLQTEISTLKDTLQQSITRDIQANVAQAVDKQNQQLTALEQNVTNQLANQTQRQQQFMNTVDDSINVSEKNMIHLNEQLAALSTTDNKVWLISQANYLVNLAGRKIWNDEDYTTARLLLKNADLSLAQANDPSLLPARQAINKDIAALAAISFTDFDGIVMTLMELTDSVTELPLVDNYQQIDLGLTNHDDTISDPVLNDGQSQSMTITDSAATSENGGISSSISNWYDNLVKSGQSFMSKFIQVEKYDSFGECVANAGKDTELLRKCQVITAIVMPEQALYLRENIKLRLLIAAQAVPRHQELTYLRALSDVNVWVNAYFDVNNSSVKAFLNELADLQQQSISNLNVPTELASQKELDKLMQTRVRAMLAN